MCYDIRIVSFWMYFVHHLRGESMEKQSVVLRFPKALLDRIDRYKEQKGFGTRTQTIFHLIQVALERSDNRDR